MLVLGVRSPSESGLAGPLACRAASNSMGSLYCPTAPLSAYWAYSNNWARRSHVGGAFGAHLAWHIRLHCSHSTALFLTFWLHTRQITGFPNVVLTKECSRGDMASGSFDILRLEGEPSGRTRSGEEAFSGSGISSWARYRRASDFWF